MDLDLFHPALHAITLQVSVNKSPTTLVFNEYPSHYLIIVKQENGVTAAGQIMLRQRDFWPEFSIDILADCHLFKEVAESIAVNLKLDKPILLFLTLGDFGISTVATITHYLLKCISKY